MAVAASLSSRDLDVLRRLQDAGVIHLDGLTLDVDQALVDWTYEDVRRRLVASQGLTSRRSRKGSTVEKTVNALRYLEGHEVPVQLRPPDEASWRRHVYHRLEEEGVPRGCLENYRKALRRLLLALDVPVWASLGQAYRYHAPVWTLPPDDLVARFWLREDHHSDRVLARTLAYVFHAGYHLGVRPPSELCALNVDDVDRAARAVVVTEPKKHGKRRLLDRLPGYVVDASNAKSLGNYIDHVRPLVDQGKSRALFLDPRTGTRFDDESLRSLLSKAGKRIWPRYSPNTMRRWYATRLLIETQFNIYLVAQRLGDTVKTVETHYLDHARAMEAAGCVGFPRTYG